jgi:chromate transporter
MMKGAQASLFYVHRFPAILASHPPAMHAHLAALPSPVSLRSLLVLAQAGLRPSGGPAGQIAMMHAELVETALDLRATLPACLELLHAAAGAGSDPAGHLHRLAAAPRARRIVAGLLFLLPSLLLLIVLSWLYMAYGHVAAIAAVLYGIKPAVVAIVVAAAWRLGRRTLRSAGLIAAAAAAFVAIAALRLPFPLIVLGAAVLGMAGGRWLPRHFHAAGAPHAAARWPGPDRRRHAHAGHARFSWPRLLGTAATGLALALLAWLALALAGADQPLAQMGVFFSKAALLTFGGRMPCCLPGAGRRRPVPLAHERADDGWPGLGETTPGP